MRPRSIYTGKELTPDVEVTLGDKLLTNGVDYTVTYEKNVNVGTANVIVKGTGNYKDTITKTFRIAAADISSAVAYKISDRSVEVLCSPPTDILFRIHPYLSRRTATLPLP